jgi:2-haloacid dehalogenase
MLKPCPRILRCFPQLRDAGFVVWALTAGDTSHVARYLAQDGVDMPEDNFVSCETSGTMKLAPGINQF